MLNADRRPRKLTYAAARAYRPPSGNRDGCAREGRQSAAGADGPAAIPMAVEEVGMALGRARHRVARTLRCVLPGDDMVAQDDPEHPR